MDRQDIIAALASRQTYPAAAISYCRNTPERTTAVFLPLLQRVSEGIRIEPIEEQALYLGAHLLASANVKDLFSPLLVLATQQEETLFRVFGTEGIATSFPRVLMSVSAGEGARLWDAVQRRHLDFLVRDAFLRAWTYEVFEGRISTVTADNRLRAFLHTDNTPPADDLIWNGWLNAIADLGLDDLLPLARQAMTEGRILAEWDGRENSDFQAFTDALKEAGTAEDRSGFQKKRGYVPFGTGPRDWGDFFLSAPADRSGLSIV